MLNALLQFKIMLFCPLWFSKNIHSKLHQPTSSKDSSTLLWKVETPSKTFNTLQVFLNAESYFKTCENIFQCLQQYIKALWHTYNSTTGFAGRYYYFEYYKNITVLICTRSLSQHLAFLTSVSSLQAPRNKKVCSFTYPILILPAFLGFLFKPLKDVNGIIMVQPQFHSNNISRICDNNPS